MSVEMLKSVTIDQLKVGVFIVKLDISWLESPFFGRTRLIQKSEEIDKLRSAGAKNIVIDLSKGLDVDGLAFESILPTATLLPRVPQNHQSSDFKSIEAQKVKHTTVAQEMGAALLIRKQIKQTMDELQMAIAKHAAFDTAMLLPLVDETLQSLSRNDQALLSLVHISRKTQKLADHAFGCFCLALNLALVLDMPAHERAELGLAALFHETGWSALPLNLLGKRTPYSKNELNLVRRHPLISEKLLKKFELPQLTQRIVLEHHERLDGSGYPNQLSGQSIHPLSQLFAVVDAYEERVHQLMDEPGMLPTNALKSLYRDAEKGMFDPIIVASLIGMLGIYPPTTPVLLNTGEKAVVKEVRTEHPLMPIIAIYYDKSGLAHADPLVIDLQKQAGYTTQRSISAPLDLQIAGNDPAKRLRITEDDLV